MTCWSESQHEYPARVWVAEGRVGVDEQITGKRDRRGGRWVTIQGQTRSRNLFFYHQVVWILLFNFYVLLLLLFYSSLIFSFIMWVWIWGKWSDSRIEFTFRNTSVVFALTWCRGRSGPSAQGPHTCRGPCVNAWGLWGSILQGYDPGNCHPSGQDWFTWGFHPHPLVFRSTRSPFPECGWDLGVVSNQQKTAKVTERGGYAGASLLLALKQWVGILGGPRDKEIVGGLRRIAGKTPWPQSFHCKEGSSDNKPSECGGRAFPRRASDGATALGVTGLQLCENLRRGPSCLDLEGRDPRWYLDRICSPIVIVITPGHDCRRGNRPSLNPDTSNVFRAESRSAAVLFKREWTSPLGLPVISWSQSIAGQK